MHYVYILYNSNIDKYYIGETYDISKRLDEHRNGTFEKSYTRVHSEWELKKQIVVSDRIEARKVEDYIKKMKSRKFINQIIADETYYKNFKSIVLEKFAIKILD